ncbi:MAG: nickel-responsive transcriptional regulator NikR [Candidatus Firestonebacteria bacterium]
MSELVRFGVSLEKKILTKFDEYIKEKNYSNRSKAISDLIRESLIKKEWAGSEKVSGVITLVYNHHKRELVNKLIDIQHDFSNLIISSQHIHLDNDNCLEIVVAKGKPKEMEELSYKLKSAKGVKYGSLTMATTGKEI